MSQAVRQLEPSSLWNHFADLNAVPRPSKKEERVIAFAKNFGESLGFKTMVDEVGNVIIYKPATSGMEDRQTVVLQSHLDMVHQKNNDTQFDFDTQGIEMLVENDWVRANGTTLGADNGIGVAAIMALLSSTDIPHPPLEALFTIDEETGMTGAMGLKGGLLEAKIMLNLDTEDDDELTIGCAGGVDVTAEGTYDLEDTPSGLTGYRLTVRGLNGGHSGMDIHKGLGNANKIMNRLLYRSYENYGVRLARIEGGSLRNAIPRESVAHLAVPANQDGPFAEHIQALTLDIRFEHRTVDPDLEVVLEAVDTPAQVAEEGFTDRLIGAIYAAPNGIFRMSPEVEGLVQTSNNVARIELIEGTYRVLCLARSSSETEKADIANALTATFEAMGANVSLSGNYPGWEPKPDAPINQLMVNIYKDMFQEDPHVYACHAGLECGILGTNYPGMDMISFGPNIRGAHSPDEKVQVSSVQKFWKYLLQTLERIPMN